MSDARSKAERSHAKDIRQGVIPQPGKPQKAKKHAAKLWRVEYTNDTIRSLHKQWHSIGLELFWDRHFADQDDAINFAEKEKRRMGRNFQYCITNLRLEK